jgi:hypothetical protein
VLINFIIGSFVENGYQLKIPQRLLNKIQNIYSEANITTDSEVG